MDKLPEGFVSLKSVQGEITLENRTGVDIRLSANLAVALALDQPMQFPEPREHDVVIIVSAGVARDRSGGLLSPVIECHHDRRARAIIGKPRVAPLVGAAS